MEMIAQEEKRYTIEDLWELSHHPEYTNQHLELSAGRLVMMSPTGWKHGEIAGELHGLIWAYARQHQLGKVTAAETGYILYKNPATRGKDTVRAPDIGFVKAERVPEQLPDKYVPFAPDLAVEVISPGDEADEIDQKVRDYLKYGTAMVWLIYPRSKSATVCTASGYLPIEPDGILDGGDVLPGFVLKLAELFS